jgi:hypothetical protein
MLGMVHLRYINVLNEYFLHKQKNALSHIHCYFFGEQQKLNTAGKRLALLLQVRKFCI